MALPASGPLSLTDIQTEFGGTNPISLNEYYAGGGLVPAGTSGTYGAVPTSGQISIQNFYGTSNFVPVYVENLFSTFLYNGNDTARTITNNINLSTDGGLIWTKCRSVGTDHALVDTVRGASQVLHTETSQAQVSYADVTSFTSTGYTLSSGSSGWFNTTPRTYVSWTFRKTPKFFDIVTYTGTGVARTIAHNLGSVPGCIILKRIDNNQGGSNWYVYHRANTTGGSPQGLEMGLNSTSGTNSNTAIWNNTAPTSSVFSIGAGPSPAEWNGTSGTYVAYLFAHDAGGFGVNGTDNVISCGAFTTDGSGSATVNLGYEPQWIFVRATRSGDNWTISDNMRGQSTGGNNMLIPNSGSSESTYNTAQQPTSTGFTYNQGFSGQQYIYIAVRRGPMKVPTVGTTVFTPATRTGTGYADTVTSAGFPIDLIFSGDRSVGRGFNWDDRLSGAKQSLRSWTNAGYTSDANGVTGFDSMTGMLLGDGQTFGGGYNVSGENYVYEMLRRAPSFFDIVAYKGDNVSGRALNHNLGVAAEFVIQKKTNSTSGWAATVLSQAESLFLNTNDPRAGIKTVSSSNSTTFTITSSFNGDPDFYIAYLFATCAGVSKVGTYTGTGALQTINCGFSTGARFVLIKRYDSTGDWFVYDSARGISSGNDPYLLLNSTATETGGTNYVDTTSVGFQVTAAAPAALNANGGTFVFLAIA